MSFEQSGIEAVVKNLNGFLSDVGKMDRAIDELGSSTSGITSWNNKITSVTSTITKTVGIAIAGVGAAFTGFVADSVRKSADFEQGLANIGAVLGKTMDQISPLKDLILDLGLDPTLKVNASEAAQAIEMLARNGLEMTEILDGAARSTILLANATGGDFSLAADTVTDAMGVFKISAEDMASAVDQVTGVTSNSKFTLQDYAYAISAGGSAAANAGVEFEDYNAVLAGTAQAFSGGSDAGTSFKTFVTRLVPSTNSASDAMKALGLYTGLTRDEFLAAEEKIEKYQKQLIDLDPTSKNFAKQQADLTEKIQILKGSLVEGQNAFFDTSGSMKGMDEVAGILQGAFGDLTEEQRIHYSQMIFGQDAYRTAIGLAELGTDKFNDLKTAIGDVDAEKNAEIRMGTLSGAMEILSGIVETLQIRIGNKFNPVVSEMTKRFSTFIEQHSDDIVDFFGVVADKVAGAVTELIPLAEQWLPKLVEWVGNSTFSLAGLIPTIADTVLGIKSFIGKVGETVQPLIDWVTKNVDLDDLLAALTATIVISLIPAITSFITTITPVIAVITSIATLVGQLDEKHRNLALAIGVAVFAIPPIISAFTAISAAVTGVIGVGSSLIGLITGGAGIVASLGALLNPVGLVVAAVAGLGIAWATDFGGIRTTTTEVVKDVGQSIGTWLDDTKKKYGETHNKIGETLASWSSTVGTTFSNMAESTGSTLSSWATRMGEKFFGLKNDVVGSNRALATESLQEFGRLASEGSIKAQVFKSALLSETREASTGSRTNFQSLTNEGLTQLARLFSEGSTKAQQLSNKLKEQSLSASGSVRSNFYNMVGDSLSSISRLLNEGSSKFTSLKDNTLNKIGEVVREVPSRLGTMVTNALRVFDISKWVQAGADIIGGIMEGLARMATAPLRWIENLARSMITGFTSLLGIRSPSTVFEEYGINIMEGLEGGLSDGGETVLSYMDSFSRDLTTTLSETQRQAEANFQALLDTAYAAYNGATTLAGGMGGTISQDIDQAAIDEANRRHAVAVYSQQYGVASVEAFQEQIPKLINSSLSGAEIGNIIKVWAEEYFASQGSGQSTTSQGLAGTLSGRVAELVDQVLDVVTVAFDVQGNGITSRGPFLSGTETSSQIQGMINALSLIMQTAQQNASTATDFDQQSKLYSLYQDIRSRLIPALQSKYATVKSEEDNAVNSGSLFGTAITSLKNSLAPILEAVSTFASQGLNAVLTPASIAAMTDTQYDLFRYFDINLENEGQQLLQSIGSYLSGLTTSDFDLKKVGDGLASLVTYLNKVVYRGSTNFGTGEVANLSQDAISSLFSQLSGGTSQSLTTLLQLLPQLSQDSTVQTNITVGDINNNTDLASLTSLLRQIIADAVGG